MTASTQQSLPLYSVILHRDTCHRSPQEVANKLVKVVMQLAADEALAVVQESWRNDQAVIVSRPRELAEYYREQLRERGLAITIQPL